METPALHHHWLKGTFDPNCKRCKEMIAASDLLAACERSQNLLEQIKGLNMLPDVFSDWITQVHKECEAAIAKAKP